MLFFSAIRAFMARSGWMFLLGGGSLAASRVSQTVSFFLPLKIFIVISSHKVPSYFDFLPNALTYDEKIVILACAVPFTYLAYIAFGVMHRWFTDRHLRVFSGKSIELRGKDVPQKNIARLHNHSAKALAECLFFVMSMVIAIVLNPIVALTIFILVYLNLMLFYHTALKAEDSERLTFLGLHRRQFIEYVSSSNFMIVFAVLVLDTMFIGTSIYSTIFLLLLCRMVFQALNRFSNENIHILRLTR
ncbi:hypothetical protein CEK62_06945 [Alcanivorax sp. N3-2A]|nr:hypothetical protein CEK62_06945 [Alcanivorax sp. N3-2A]|tara:strand:+ start:9322 stop:10059 length:738 start_codon:yes stop_codon:yes gene_type:complete